MHGWGKQRGIAASHPQSSPRLPQGKAPFMQEYRNLYFQNDARRMDSALEQA